MPGCCCLHRYPMSRPQTINKSGRGIDFAHVDHVFFEALWQIQGFT